MDENQIIELKEIRNSISDKFEKYYNPLETSLNYIDSLMEVNDRDKKFRKRRELNTQLKFNIIFLTVWKTLIDADTL